MQRVVRRLTVGAMLTITAGLLAGCALLPGPDALRLSGGAEQSLPVTAHGAWSSIDLQNHDTTAITLKSVRFLDVRNGHVTEARVTTPGKDGGIGLWPVPLSKPLQAQVDAGSPIAGYELHHDAPRHELAFLLVPRNPHQHASVAGAVITYTAGGIDYSETTLNTVCLRTTDNDECGLH